MDNRNGEARIVFYTMLAGNGLYSYSGFCEQRGRYYACHACSGGAEKVYENLIRRVLEQAPDEERVELADTLPEHLMHNPERPERISYGMFYYANEFLTKLICFKRLQESLNLNRVSKLG